MDHILGHSPQSPPLRTVVGGVLHPPLGYLLLLGAAAISSTLLLVASVGLFLGANREQILEDQAADMAENAEWVLNMLPLETPARFNFPDIPLGRMYAVQYETDVLQRKNMGEMQARFIALRAAWRGESAAGGLPWQCRENSARIQQLVHELVTQQHKLESVMQENANHDDRTRDLHRTFRDRMGDGETPADALAHQVRHLAPLCNYYGYRVGLYRTLADFNTARGIVTTELERLLHVPEASDAGQVPNP